MASQRIMAPGGGGDYGRCGRGWSSRSFGGAQMANGWIRLGPTQAHHPPHTRTCSLHGPLAPHTGQCMLVCVLSAARVCWPAGPLWVLLHGLPCALSLVRKVGAGRWGGESIADARGIGDGSPSPPVPPSGNTLIPILTFPTALLNSGPSVRVVARTVSPYYKQPSP